MVREALAGATVVAEETMSNIRTVRSFANEEKQLAAYNEKVTDTLNLGVKAAFAYGLFTGGTSGVGMLAFVAIIYYGGTLVLEGELSSGDLTSFLLYALSVGTALSGLAGLFGAMMAAVGANDRVFQILDRIPFVPVDEGNACSLPVKGDIEFKKAVFAYPARPDIQVLKELELRIPAGTVAALVGPSGGGKSTILACIERFYDVDGGAVLVDGVDVKIIAGSSLRRSIGYVAQEPVLFAMSIKDNISFGKPGASDEEVLRAAKVANAAGFINDLPSKFDTQVGEKGVRLSGGQRQRIAIARALLQDPAILLLDEATSALDAESEHLVKEALERLMIGRTVVIVAHRLSTVSNADTVFVIQAGKVVGQGRHEELLNSSPLYAKLVKRQLIAASSMAPTRQSSEREALSDIDLEAGKQLSSPAETPAAGVGNLQEQDDDDDDENTKLL
jgi:ABC-type multidrug transport system fused ATPase/permease subunit